MPMTATEVQKLYVAYFNRPADYLGQEYWKTQSPAAAAQAFAASAEYASTYAGMDVGARVNAIYQNLFGHAADLPGLTYWSNQVQSGRLTIADVVVAVSNGAQGTDLDAFNAKVSAASSFTTALDTTAEVTGYSGTAANNAAKAWLAGINSAAQATAATATAALNATVASVVANAGGTQGGTYTLTSNADTFDPNSATAASKTSANDDTFRAPTDGLLGTTDYIDGGAGTDTLTASITANGQTLAPAIRSVENITLTVTAADTKAFTFNAVDVIGASTVSIKDAGAASMAASDEKISVTNLSKATTFGIIGGTAATGATASEIDVTFASAAAADTQKIAVSNAAKTAALSLVTAETVEITATGAASTITALNATAVKSLNIKGTGDLTISGSDLSASVKVDASGSTGKVTFVGETGATSTTFTGGSANTSFTTASTGTVSVTTGAGNDTIDISGGNSTSTVVAGAGNDRVLVGAQANVTAVDSISGGDGTLDTIAISDATVGSATKTALATTIVSGFERLETTSTSVASVDFNGLSTWSDVVLSGAVAAAYNGTADKAGSNATTVTKVENNDTLIISAARTGNGGGKDAATGAGDAAGELGGDGINLSPLLDNGSNVANLRFVGNADITGGVGELSKGGAGELGGNGGDALDAANFESVNIVVVGTVASGGTADTVTFAGGAGGGKGAGGTAGSAGSSVIVGTNATITLTSELDPLTSTAAVQNNVDLGTVKGTNVTINGSAFLGKITATAGDGNVTITGGAGADALTGGAGIDTISGGAGADVITGGAAGDVLSGGAGRDAVVIGTAAHSGTGTLSGTVSFDRVSDFGKVTVATLATETAAMTNNATFVASATAKGGADADYVDFAATSTLGGAQASTDVSGASSNAGKTINAVESAKGVITVSGGDAGLIDTLTEWVAIANAVAATNGDVVAFEFGGSTYVFQQDSVNGDDLVQLSGVTGVTGIVLLGSSVAASVGDIFAL